MIIIDHTNRRYKIRRDASGENRYNGAYYYSLEIVKNIIPRIKTDRNWITLNIPGEALNLFYSQQPKAGKLRMDPAIRI